MNTHGNGTWKDVNFIPVSSRFAFGIPRGIVVAECYTVVESENFNLNCLVGTGWERITKQTVTAPPEPS
jgi:hypothetical protein